ncbi:hypothetical protein [Alicyclobacillus shizuokensis]|uniref:hypothetical protein n=1 Tax=Alicyclobacillus shizuokensis TaxID=392014 RepID=UPI0008297260|nr:hypothetical protein [Alicyclobacillus shizuokensis]
MISYSCRVSCVISVPKQELLAHAFNLELDDQSIAETRDSEDVADLLFEGKTLQDLFEPMIQDYAQQYGLQRSDIVVTKYLAVSGNKDVMVAFKGASGTDLFETQDDSKVVIAYYRPSANLGYGLELHEYLSQLPNNKYALRVGNQVPNGDVNLAYVYTPDLDSDANVALIDTSSVSDNVIPLDQMESIVVPDSTGKLQYASIVSENEPVVVRPPYDMFPSKDFVLTRRFANHTKSVDNALFYKFELKYHYDSKTGTPGQVTRYTGSEIQITDENGNPLGDGFNYLIYARCMEGNPHIYWVKIYTAFNTNEEQTFKVLYNHVDQVLPDDQLTTTRQSVLYSNQQGKAIQGGKLRIINGMSAYEETTMDTVKSADETQEVYAIDDQPQYDGYRIYVPQKSESDPRGPQIFSYKLSATYTTAEGTEETFTLGWITDWVLNPEALLEHEKPVFDGQWKNIGIQDGSSFLSAQSLIGMVLPHGIDRLPSNAVYKIEDAAGNLLYTTETAPDNPNVQTDVDSSGDNPPRASYTGTPKSPWTEGDDPNTRLKSNPIPHQCTVFAEHQRQELDFTWQASGTGLLTKTSLFESQWQAVARLEVVNETTEKMIKVFDDWDYLGPNSGMKRSDWKYDASKDQLYCTSDAVDIGAFYENTSDAKKLSNYVWSATVTVNDPGDDDVIGLIFRLKDANHYYMFAWEKQTMNTSSYKYPDGSTNPVGRILVSSKGVSQLIYDSKGASHSPYLTTKSWSDYMNGYAGESFGSKKKRIFKAKPASGSKYSADKTGNSYVDVTIYDSTYKGTGWEKNTKYQIEVHCIGDFFKVYINGSLVLTARDADYDAGTYGVMDISQKSVYWSSLKLTLIDTDVVVSEAFPVSLPSNAQYKLSTQPVSAIMAPYIQTFMKQNYGSETYPYDILGYSVNPGQDLICTIKSDGYVYGYTNSPKAAGSVTVPWSTSDNGLDVEGTGKAFFQPDGTFRYVLEPAVLPVDFVPKNVVNFQWTRIWITGGDNVALSIGPDNEVIANASPPPIEPIGRPYTLTDQILKNDGIKTLANVFGDGGIYEQLAIPKDIPQNEILLRIERGDANGNNKEFRVNYRFMSTLDSTRRFCIDQASHGVNRMNVGYVLSQLGDNPQVDLVAWTTFEDLEAVPILAIQLTDNKKIETEKPRVEKASMEISNWYLRIKNGRVKRRILLPYYEAEERVPQIYVSYPQLMAYAPKDPSDTVEVILDYTIPEYTNQDFYDRPVMFVENERPLIIDETTIQTRYAPIVLSSETGISYLEVEALHMNYGRILRISDVDAEKGIIYLYDRIRDNDDVVVRYAYREEWYTYRGFERQNPSTGDTVLFHLDLNPSPGHRITLAQDGFHEWIPGDVPLREVYTEQERESNQMLVRQIHVYLRPTAIWLPGASSPIEGTTRTQAVFHTTEANWFDPNDYLYDPTMLRLAKVSVQANSRIDKDMIVLDTRSRGGGLDEALSNDIIAAVNKESLYHWDIGFFDGEAYQENGVMIIRLPRSILKTESNPNGFTESQVQAVVAKHKAFGVLPIIEFYSDAENDLNVIGNPEFSYGEHVDQYNKDLSYGVYQIEQSSDDVTSNWVLRIIDDARYGVSIPGYRLTYSTYDIIVRARLDNGAQPRKAGVLQITKTDGSTETVLMPTVNSTSWDSYVTVIPIDQAIDRVDLILGGGQDVTEDLLIDSIRVEPVYNVDETQMEVHDV